MEASYDNFPDGNVSFNYCLQGLLSIMHAQSRNQHFFNTDSATPENWEGLGDVHYNAYRIFCLLAAVLSPAIGIIYRFTDPTAIEPIWARLTVALVALFLVTLSYMHEGVKRYFVGLTRLYFYLFTAYCIGLTALNSFATNYALGLLFAVTAIGIAFSFGLRRVHALIYYMAFSILLTGSAFFLVAIPQASPVVLLLCLLSTALVTYVVASSKLRAEEAIQVSARRYQKLLRAANDAIFIADPATSDLLDANEKAQELSGRSLAELRRMTYQELFPAANREHYVDLLEKHTYEGRPLIEELYVEKKEGELVPVDVSASIIDVGDGKLIQGIFRDITDSVRFEAEQEARKRAEELLQLKTSFMNNMSHEIRTPLASILGYAEVLTEEVDEEQQDFARTITMSAERLQKTLTSVLKLAELESGNATLDPKAVNVAAEARDVASLLNQLARQKGIDLRVQIQATAAYAHVDPTCLNRILNNLIGNAIKFTEEGHVTVVVEADAANVHLRVQDTGIGIDSEFIDQLFDEFKQESTGLARSHEGTGLGLAITKRLVELMDGTIEAESEKGSGSTFTVSFPRLLPANGTTTDTTKEGGSRYAPETAGKRLLVVDDNPEMLDLLKHRLGAYHTVRLARNPREALAAVQEGPVDAFILDINLAASQDGVELLQALRLLTGHRRTPALALTAYAMPGDREHFLESGFSSYLAKPFTKRRLLEKVDQILIRPNVQKAKL